MCRSKEKGGRRCPHGTNPAAVASRNARRRESYKIKKLGVEGVVPVKVSDTFNGFLPPEVRRMPEFTDEEVYAASALELEGLTEEQRYGLTQFTGDYYEIINGALFGKKVLHKTRVSKTPGHENPSALAGFKEVVSSMDDAFMASPLRERMVYRGKRPFDITGAYSEESVKSYLQENYAVGSEVTFDGYQSTSLSPIIAAANYSHSGGIVFEMKSKSGINVSNESKYKDELEVLLPRATRWKVVSVEKMDYKSGELGGHTKEHKNVTVVQMIEIASNGDELTERVAPPALAESQMRTYM